MNDPIKKGDVFANRKYFVLITKVTDTNVWYKFFERANYAYHLRGKKKKLSKPLTDPICVMSTLDSFLNSIIMNNLILCEMFQFKEPMHIS